MTNDKKLAHEEDEERRSAYHLHVFLSIPESGPYQVTNILPKSGNWRDGEPNIELVGLPPKKWIKEVHGMDPQTKTATEWFAAVFYDYSHDLFYDQFPDR